MKLKTMTAAVALLLVCAGVAKAETDTSSYGKVSGTVGMTSDYRFRGMTQTGEVPAIQGSIDWAHDSGLYAGIWGSNVKFTDATIETDVYAGYKFGFSGLNLDVGVTGYLYPGAADNLNYDYWEGKVVATYDFGFASVNAGVNYSPDFFGASGDALFSSAGFSVPVMKTGVSVIGSYGYQTIEKNANFGGVADYGTWTAGLTYTWNGFNLSATYVDTSISKAQCPDGCDGASIFSVSRTF
jgi:uncharacterized protein (TIGR02001 family)